MNSPLFFFTTETRRRGGSTSNSPCLSASVVHLCQESAHDLSMDIGQAEVPARMPVRQLLVVEPQEPEDGGVQVVDVDLVFDRLEAELVGRAVHLAALHAAAGQPHGETVVVVVAAVQL